MFDSLSFWIWGIVALDLVVAVAAICALRYASGVLFSVDSRDELAEKDNLAFGLALAGGAVAVALVLAAAGAGDPALTFATELGIVVAYAVTGLVLLKLGMLINDWIMFHKFSVKAAIRAQNTAAGTVQAANLIALGVLINGAVNWASGDLVQGLLSVVVMFLLVQIVLLAVTRTRAAIYARRHDGETWQHAIEGGNSALAVRYAGHLIGTALASSAAGGMVSFVPGADTVALIAYVSWFVWAVVLAAALLLLSTLAQRVILSGVDVVEEVDNQSNVGVAAIEAAVFLGLGLVIRAVAG